MNPPIAWPGRINRIDTCESTQLLAREAIENGSWRDRDVFVAGTMSRGRGAGGSWHAPLGGVWMSLICEGPPGPVSFWAPVAAAVAIERQTGLRPSLKWPNDVLIGDRKVAGVLIERLAEPAVHIIGIGINATITGFPPWLEQIATSLSMEIPGESGPDPERLLDQLLGALLETEGTDLVAAFGQRCPSLGGLARIIEKETASVATLRSINADGSLELALADGSTRTLHAAAHIDVRPIAPPGSQERPACP